MWNKEQWKKFAYYALMRAIRTFFQTFVSVAGVDGIIATFAEVDWIRALSAAGVAFVFSLATSVATGLPEMKQELAEVNDAGE